MEAGRCKCWALGHGWRWERLLFPPRAPASSKLTCCQQQRNPPHAPPVTEMKPGAPFKPEDPCPGSWTPALSPAPLLLNCCVSLGGHPPLSGP